jgi:hypothetical protein
MTGPPALGGDHAGCGAIGEQSVGNRVKECW